MRRAWSPARSRRRRKRAIIGLEADAAGDAESNGVVVGLALKMARVASLNQDGGEGASGGEERADVAEEEADEKEKAHFS